MYKSVLTRLTELEERAEHIISERKKHEPFFEVVPWCLMRDEVIVYHYSEGTYRKPTVYENMPFAPVVEWAKNNCKEYDIEFAMDSCAEWLYLRSLSNPRYSEEQRERTAEKWLADYPEFELLSTDPQEIEFAQIIGRFPQQFRYYGE